MSLKITNKTLLITLLILVLITGGLIFYAYSQTWGKINIAFNIKIDEQLVYQSTFGESPTFAIWIEDPVTGLTQTVYATRRAAEGDWEGKGDVPVAIPKWFEIREIEKEQKIQLNNLIADEQAITSPTPMPGYFSTQISVKPGSKWVCWIEVNLAGDFNEYYREFDIETMTYDEYLSGQPPLLYRAEFIAEEGNRHIPEIVGMSILDPDNGVTIQPLSGITTAKYVFEKLFIEAVKPKPRIF